MSDFEDQMEDLVYVYCPYEPLFLPSITDMASQWKKVADDQIK